MKEIQMILCQIDNKSNELDIVDVHKAVDITDICESGHVVMDEKNAIEALAQVLDAFVRSC